MARPRKISEEELFNILNKYIENNPYITTLKYADLVRYSKEELGHENIEYQDFSRNKNIKEFIKIYKERKDMTSYIKLNNDKLEKVDFNVDDVVDRYKSTPKQLKSILKVFKDVYDNAFSLLSKYEKSNSKNMEIIKEQENTISNLKEKNKELREQLVTQKQNNSESYRIEKLKWVYLGIKDIIDNTSYDIETKEEVLDILKNFGYSSEDVVDVEKIIQDEFSVEKVIDEPIVNGEENKSNDDNPKSNVIHLEKSKLNLPSFMIK